MINHYKDEYIWYLRKCNRNAAFNIIFCSLFGQSLLDVNGKTFELYSQCIHNFATSFFLQKIGINPNIWQTK